MPVYSPNSFRIDEYAMRYSDFVPRLFNLCLSLGMEPNKIMPSRAFCSDESQGYPIILIAKHFGTFPFNHGRVGGIVAADRHAPHSHHGKDMVIIQASHVGYEPETEQFGIYKRLQTENQEYSTDCGAICNVIGWYENEYEFACQHIKLDQDGEDCIVIIDNQLLHDERKEGLFLKLDKVVSTDATPIRLLSTAKAYLASSELVKRLGSEWPDKKESIGKNLHADLFYFRKDIETNISAIGHINRNLINSMPGILTSKYPALSAAQVNAQVEFDRTFRTIVKEHAYRGKKLVYLSGINIDISPREDHIFPLTKCVPWAAYIQNEDDTHYTLEQDELYALLMEQRRENPYKIDLTEAIGQMKQEVEIKIHAD